MTRFCHKNRQSMSFKFFKFNTVFNIYEPLAQHTYPRISEGPLRRQITFMLSTSAINAISGRSSRLVASLLCSSIYYVQCVKMIFYGYNEFGRTWCCIEHKGDWLPVSLYQSLVRFIRDRVHGYFKPRLSTQKGRKPARVSWQLVDFKPCSSLDTLRWLSTLELHHSKRVFSHNKTVWSFRTCPMLDKYVFSPQIHCAAGMVTFWRSLGIAETQNNT